MSNSENNLGKVLLAGILVLIGIVGSGIMMRVHPLGFMVILLAALAIGIIYYLLKNSSDKKEAARYAKTTEGRVAQRLENCKKELSIHQREIADIRQYIF